jgi:hypothetical protein
MVLVSDGPDVLQLVKELQDHYDQRNRMMDRWAGLAFGELGDRPTNDDAAGVRLPTGFSIVQLATAILGAQRPRIRVPRPSDTMEDQEQAETIQQFLQGCWDMNVREYEIDALERAIWWAVVVGWFGFKVLFDPNAKAKKGDGWDRFPLRIDARNPRTLYPQPCDGRPGYVVERYERKWGEVRRQWADELNEIGLYPESYKDTDKVTWTEYWDEERMIYLVQDKEMVNEDHGYGFVPYAIGHGYESPLLEGDRRGIGLLAPISDVLRQEQELFTQRSAIAEKYAWPTILVESVLGDKFELNQSPGAVNYLMPGDSVTFLEWRSTMPELETLHQQTRSYIERSTFTGVQFGERPVAGTTGYLASLLSATSQLKLQPIKRSLELTMAAVNEMLLKLVEAKVEGTLSVDGMDHRNKDFEVSIEAKDIKGYRRNIVELQVMMPGENVEKAMTGLRLSQQGIISRLTAREKYAEVESPQEEQQLVLAEKILEHPLVLAGAGLKAAQDWGYDVDELARELEQAKSVNAGQPPQRALPPGPGGAPGMAAAMAGGKPSPGGLPPVAQASVMQRLIQPPGGPRRGPLPGTGGRPRTAPMGQPSPIPRGLNPGASPVAPIMQPPSLVAQPRMAPGLAPALTRPGTPRAGTTTVRPPNPVPRAMRTAPPLAPAPPPPMSGMPVTRMPRPMPMPRMDMTRLLPPPLRTA